MSTPSPLTPELTVEILRDAFKPLHCGATYRSGWITFQVLDDAEKVVVHGNPLDIYEYQDRAEVERLIRELRQMIESQSSYALDSWVMPLD